VCPSATSLSPSRTPLVPFIFYVSLRWKFYVNIRIIFYVSLCWKDIYILNLSICCVLCILISKLHEFIFLLVPFAFVSREHFFKGKSRHILICHINFVSYFFRISSGWRINFSDAEMLKIKI